MKIKTKSTKFKMRLPPTPLEKKMKEVKAQIPTSGAPLAAMCGLLASQIQARSNDKGYKHLTAEYLQSHLEQIEVKSQGSYYSQNKLYAIFNYPESDGDFARRMKEYESDLAEYQSWRKENAKAVAEYERGFKQKQQEKLNQKQALLNQKMVALQSKMSKLQGMAA